MKEYEIFSDSLLTLKKGYSISEINKVISEKKLLGVRLYQLGGDYIIDYFEELVNLEKVHTIMLFGCFNYEFLYSLKELKQIIIQIVSAKLDLQRLPNLLVLDSQWDNVFFVNLDKAINLKYLALGDFNGKFIDQICCLHNLKVLSISSKGLKNLDGLKGLKNLEYFTLSDFGIQNIEGIKDNKELKILNLIDCRKLIDISAISNLESLEILKIENCKNIESLKGLNKLKKLKQVFIEGTTVINDFDLSYIEHVENIYIHDPRKYNVNALENLNVYSNMFDYNTFLKRFYFYKQI